LPTVPTRSAETAAEYLEEGRRHLRHAQQQYPTIYDPIEALLVALEDDQTILKGSTCRLYKQQHIAIIDEILAGQPDAARRRALSLGRIQLALQRRRGRPPKARTSSLKVTDATKDEAVVLLRYLAKRARGKANAHLVCMLALYLYFVPRTGCRPIEWSNASVEDTWLVVRNAKNSNGRSGFETRRIGLRSFPPRVIEAAAVFARCIPESISGFRDFSHWRNALAELLARCCKTMKLRRLSLYSFRHVALATWARAGASPWEIAALAGHASPRTARRHYASARHGWILLDGIVTAEPSRVTALQQKQLETSLTNENQTAAGPITEVQANASAEDDKFDIEDLPEPAAPSKAHIWRPWLEQWEPNQAAMAMNRQRDDRLDSIDDPDIAPRRP
jgi:integrase